MSGDVSLSRGPTDTVLPAVPDDWSAALAAALAAASPERRSAIASVVAQHPTYLEAWGRLAESAGDVVESYACARVGYHRGLDQLRAAGWRGTGYVRWQHPENQGFLRSLEALRAGAAAIGEDEEAERCALFLRQLDPQWRGLPPA
ncbi:MAG: hypothetical protein JWM85_369 [Acidimicrobiaceae bacterium]|nr:hypothetical protein [Acidimicrobiaceae bacterium]